MEVTRDEFYEARKFLDSVPVKERYKYHETIVKRRYFEQLGYETDRNGELVHWNVYRKYWDVPKNWTVRHLDGNRKNNSITNLIAHPKYLNAAIQDWETRNGCRATRSQIEKWMRDRHEIPHGNWSRKKQRPIWKSSFTDRPKPKSQDKRAKELEAIEKFLKRKEKDE